MPYTANVGLSRPQVYFFLPRHRWPVTELPARITEKYIEEVSHVFFNGQWLSWTFQTYLRLSASGYPCRLVDSIPADGIIVGSRADLHFSTRPKPSQVFVCLLGGAGYLPYAQVQVVQNQGQLDEWPDAYHIPHWTQPGLVPRRADRGALVENAAFFGHPNQLAPELHDEGWAEHLSGLGITWHKVHQDSPRKSDYSDIDLIIAIRSFDGDLYPRKPATKLLNAWHAGIPAILGPESEYRAQRRSELDFIEVTTYEDLCMAVERLQSHPELWLSMARNGRQRAEETTHELMVERYIRLIDEVAIPRYHSWRAASALGRKLFLAGRYAHLKKLSLRKRLKPN